MQKSDRLTDKIANKLNASKCYNTQATTSWLYLIVNNSISLQDSNLYHVPVAYGARTGEAWLQNLDKCQGIRYGAIVSDFQKLPELHFR